MSLFIWLIGSLLGTTWRITVQDPFKVDIFNDRTAGRIYCFWHCSLLAISYIFRNTGKTAVISQSRDGRVAAEVARRWKHEIIFGSSSRGGTAAMRDSIRLLEKRRCLAITPDGPRGPKEKVKPGIARMAITANAPVVPILLEVDRCWRLNSWDRFLIPKPFARITVTLCNPLAPPPAPATDILTGRFRHLIEERLTGDASVAV